jgi:hypothetical protein
VSRNRRSHILGPALLLSAFACTAENAPATNDGASTPDGLTAAIQTDTTFYVLERDEHGWGTQIAYRFRNATADTIYAINCNGAISMAVEKKEPTGWRTFWAPVTNACLSPPITVPPGETFSAPLSLWGAPPGGNVGPAFSDTTIEGTYRLVWWNLVSHYAEDRQGFGDTLPLDLRVSNEFTLRGRR